jgi:hypothetical protein
MASALAGEGEAVRCSWRPFAAEERNSPTTSAAATAAKPANLPAFATARRGRRPASNLALSFFDTLNTSCRVFTRQAFQKRFSAVTPPTLHLERLTGLRV